MPDSLSPPAGYLELAGQHVRDAERKVLEQHQRIDRLRVAGLDTSDAMELLGTFNQTLLAMQEHLRIETLAAI